ncbi:MAG: hypothetical protein R3B89_20240 [Polyangiaceae bacterium]
MQFFTEAPGMVLTLLVFELLLVIGLISRRRRASSRTSVLPRAYLASRGGREPLTFHERLGL